MKIRTLFNIIFLLATIYSQDYFTMDHDGYVREYYVSYPENVLGSAPLIISMHGFGGTALDQQLYTEMDNYAHPMGVAVVYPQGLGYSWNVGAFWTNFNIADDIDFISELIDKVSEDYLIDLEKVYATGMSNGGYMTYELACELSHKIAAFGSVTGNFMLNNDQVCNPEKEVPIIHIHGTSDAVVDYYPPSFDGALTVSESIEYWNDINKLDSVDTENLIGELGVLSAEKFTYFRQSTQTKFIHYKVENGGHDWFGSPYVSPSVVNASELLVNFFLEYSLHELPCLSPNGDVNGDEQINTFDFLNMLSHISSLDYIYEDSCLDLNADSYIDIIDLLLMSDLVF
tara:strand:+ start:216 stop:1244 length:1029 start_codon:yes stop_codon:yes gene_type:complete